MSFKSDFAKSSAESGALLFKYVPYFVTAAFDVAAVFIELVTPVLVVGDTVAFMCPLPFALQSESTSWQAHVGAAQKYWPEGQLVDPVHSQPTIPADGAGVEVTGAAVVSEGVLITRPVSPPVFIA